MTIPYNVTTIGISDKILNNFLNLKIDTNKLKFLEESNELDLDLLSEINNNDELLIKNEKEKSIDYKILLIPDKNLLKNKNKSKTLYLTYSDLFKLSNIIKITVLEIIPTFNILSKYFESIINIMKKLDLPIN